MKRGYIVILITLWILAFVKFIGSEADKEPDFVNAFSNDSYLSTTSSIGVTVYCGNLYYSDEAKQDMLVSVAEKLGISDGYELTSQVEDGKTTKELTKISKYAVTELKFVSVKNEKDEQVTRQYVMVNIDILNSLESAVVYRDKLEEIFAEMNFDADVTLTLKGNIKGMLTTEEKDNITDEIISSLGGDIVSEKKASEIYTVYAYSDKIDDYVVNGTDMTNINVAITYDEILGETNIYMATPIINEEY